MEAEIKEVHNVTEALERLEKNKEKIRDETNYFVLKTQKKIPPRTTKQ